MRASGSTPYVTAKSILAALVSTTVLATAAARADPPLGPTFVELGHDFPSFWTPGVARFAVGDYDGDGKDDVAAVGSNATRSVLFVAGKTTGGSLAVKQSALVPGGRAARVLRVPQPVGPPHLLVVGADGFATEYSGWPLVRSRQFPIVGNATSAAVGDIDADGALDLVVATGSVLAAYRLDTGVAKWAQPGNGGADVVLAQLDTDPALEIILGGSAPQGQIVDGATHDFDWRYPDPFGDRVAAGNLPGGGPMEFVAARNGIITTYSGFPYSPLWDRVDNAGYYTTAVEIGRPGSRSVPVILVGNSYTAGLRIVDAVTHQSTTLSPEGGPSEIGVIDLDGNGTREIVFANQSFLTFVDGDTGAVLGQLESRTPLLNIVGEGDPTGSGVQKILTASSYDLYNPPGGLAIRDFDSGAVEWRSADYINSGSDPFYTVPSRILIGRPVPPAGFRPIVIAGNATYDGRLIVVDGTTHAVRTQIGMYNADVMANRHVSDAALVDMDGDGVDDIVAATAPSYSGGSAARLQSFTLSGQPIWDSVAMGGYYETHWGLLVLDPASGGDDTVVAVLTSGLRAYGRLSHLLAWTLDAHNNGAAVIPQGVNGMELAVIDGTHVSFFDAATRQPLRNYSLFDPIDALTPLDGRLEHLLIASGGRLRLVDGRDGTQLAVSPDLGANLAHQNQLSARNVGPGQWQFAVGSDIGLYRFRLDLSDRVFATDFE